MTRRTLFRSLVGLAAAPVAGKTLPASVPAVDSRVIDAVMGPMMTVNEARAVTMHINIDTRAFQRSLAQSIQRLREPDFLTELEHSTLEDRIINGDPDAPEPQGILRATE